LSLKSGRADEIGRVAPDTIPGVLTRMGLKSVMVEGGSQVLSSFLRSPPRQDGSPMVDSVIITVGPMIIGDGVGVVPKVSYFHSVSSRQVANQIRKMKLRYQIYRLSTPRSWARIKSWSVPFIPRTRAERQERG
jgi:hypothetical protein